MRVFPWQKGERTLSSRSLCSGLFVACLMLGIQAFAHADETGAAKANTGDTAWMLVSTAFVMLMTPGLALFYGGMVRAKNVLNMLMQSFVALDIVSVVWVLWGYSLSFGPGGGKFLGGLVWLGLNGVGQMPNADYAACPCERQAHTEPEEARHNLRFFFVDLKGVSVWRTIAFS